MNFEYAHAWEWYTHECVADGQFNRVDDVIVTVFAADYRAMKYSRDGAVTPFKTPNIDVHAAGDGTYVALHSKPESADRARYTSYMRRKAMYVIMPQTARDADGSAIVTGDHFTFCLDSNDKRTPLHFHLTRYVPDEHAPAVGTAIHLNNYLPAEFPLPSSAAHTRGLLRDPRMHFWAGNLHRVLLRPYDRRTTAPAGGGRRRRGRRERPTNYDDIKPFARLWYDLPLHRVVAVTMPGDGGTTVYVHDRLRLGRLDDKVAFRLPAIRAASFSQPALEAAIAAELGQKVWQDFAVPA
jgi:hypothetical protein